MDVITFPQNAMVIPDKTGERVSTCHTFDTLSSRHFRVLYYQFKFCDRIVTIRLCHLLVNFEL
jgi:hypothetical protein